jgi:hypothetical protein
MQGDQLPTLTTEQQNKIADMLSFRGNPNGVVAEGFDIEILREDIRCLQPTEWLNDEVCFDTLSSTLIHSLSFESDKNVLDSSFSNRKSSFSR